MGQYHFIVNLDKREFIDPYRMGVGAKAWEQLASMPSTPQALFALLICSNGRGGGDLGGRSPTAERVIGRWAGDRIAVVGDYAEDFDLQAPLHDPASAIYDLCAEGAYRDVSDLVRPILEGDLGVVYETPGKSWDRGYFRRNPQASWSVLADETAEEGAG